ncbi:MAG: hypothetical protein HQL34_00750 [Alphaproteobacteria bacterium]|nr:hypothetical protein [Alphaproteobacteria bacterium]
MTNQIAILRQNPIVVADIAARHNMALANAADTSRRQVAARESFKLNHQRLTDTLKGWAAYVDANGAGPTQTPDKYYITVNSMIYSRLGLGKVVRHARKIKASVRDWMYPTEALAVASAETAMTEALRDGMAANASRKSIKDEYTRAADRARDYFLPLIMAERVREGAA